MLVGAKCQPGPVTALVSRRQLGDLPDFLPHGMMVARLRLMSLELFKRYAGNFRRRHFVYFSVGPEYFEPPFLASQGRQDDRLDSGIIRAYKVAIRPGGEERPEAAGDRRHGVPEHGLDIVQITVRNDRERVLYRLDTPFG